MESIEEHYRCCAARGMMDADVAEMLIATHLEGHRSGPTRQRSLLDVPRPKALKHSGLTAAKMRETG